ncbi:MAG: hypothetical protein ABSC08_17940, partial [Bryobacteraceae bacterium]
MSLAAEKQHPLAFEDLDLPARIPQARGARGLHGHAVEQAEADELLELNVRHHALVHEDGKRTLALDGREAAEAVGGDRLLEDIHAGVLQLGRDGQR